MCIASAPAPLLSLFFPLTLLAALTVTAKGLGLEVLVHNFLKVQSAPNQLVLVINMAAEEQQYHADTLMLVGATPTPRIVTAEMQSPVREQEYQNGGKQRSKHPCRVCAGVPVHGEVGGDESVFGPA
jgi:hypothetical protein